MYFIAMILGLAIGLAFKERPRQLIAMAIMMTFALSSSVASAANSEASKQTGIVISATGVTLLVSMFIPVLTGLITKVTTSSWVKGLITLVANAITALVTTATMADGTAVLSWQTIVTWLVAFVTSVGLYTGFWSTAGITSSYVKVENPDGTINRKPGKLAFVVFK